MFRFGYERFELRARLGTGNLEHAIASAAEVAASVFATWSHEALTFCAAGSRWRGGWASPSLATRHERAHGASPPLSRIPARISSSELQRTLSLRGGDRPSCPHRTLLGFELPMPPAKKQLFLAERKQFVRFVQTTQHVRT